MIPNTLLISHEWLPSPNHAMQRSVARHAKRAESAWEHRALSARGEGQWAAADRGR
jgi:hypothetical protein